MNRDQVLNRRRIIKISYKAGATHLGSALTAIDIIEAIYRTKKKEEKFVLSSGHAASALYTVLENKGYLKNPKISKLGVHPERNTKIGIEVSTGSLGHGLPIAVGMALADRSKNVYCCVSDGECAEGSIWEAVSVATKYKLNNIKIVVNANGYTGYDEISPDTLISRFEGFGCEVINIDGHDIQQITNGLLKNTSLPLVLIARTNTNQLPFLNGLSAHYYKMTKKDYKTAIKIWSKI